MRYPAEGVGITSTHVENTLPCLFAYLYSLNHLYACREYEGYSPKTLYFEESPLRM